MATVLERTAPAARQDVALLHNGDHLDQPTFHARYRQMPDDFRAELIGGVVFVPSPTTNWHAVYHAEVIGWLWHYHAYTPGTELMDNGTVILDEENEPQPDAVLRIKDECGGSSHVEDGYVVGPPELHVEVAYSSESIDLFNKYEEYQRTGVREYLVVLIREEAVRGFRLQEDGYVEQPIGADDIWRSEAFPGLWLQTKALVHQQSQSVLSALDEGLRSSEHQEFVQQLAAAAVSGQ